jgi:hypothetical protein
MGQCGSDRKCDMTGVTLSRRVMNPNPASALADLFHTPQIPQVHYYFCRNTQLRYSGMSSYNFFNVKYSHRFEMTKKQFWRLDER